MQIGYLFLLLANSVLQLCLLVSQLLNHFFSSFHLAREQVLLALSV